MFGRTVEGASPEQVVLLSQAVQGALPGPCWWFWFIVLREDEAAGVGVEVHSHRPATCRATRPATRVEALCEGSVPAGCAVGHVAGARQVRWVCYRSEADRAFQLDVSLALLCLICHHCRGMVLMRRHGRRRPSSTDILALRRLRRTTGAVDGASSGAALAARCPCET
eukprot:CAMPEP_0175185722 /NCGR_PEP_ID=MMETSP0093-20121207/2024_1 /TAXON_ID=311494 /ORGANISM="Alexandrium monilatum, Strain CCMP3105" /LENGTH=167 /DNA_ID=CAMNT_0016478425 /DNA_START=548 /DNA_END=1048 /DNA_ORIENTATION=-